MPGFREYGPNVSNDPQAVAPGTGVRMWGGRERTEQQIRRLLDGRSKRRAVNVRLVQDLKGSPCSDCHGTFPYFCMEFDHRDPSQKSGNVSRFLYRRSTLMKEIGKCDLVCALCHRSREWARSGPTQNPRLLLKPTFVALMKAKSKPCTDCRGTFHHWQMEMDHVRGEKRACVSDVVWKCGLDTLLVELEKCEPVCVVCHRKRTQLRSQGAN